jgi:periplasmic divalent cation tolerance protein
MTKSGPVTDVMVVLSTCPDDVTARRLAAGLVEAGFAACVNILPEIRSIYRWQGQTLDEAETLLIAKTTRRVYPELEAWLRKHHPYQVPEVLGLSVQAGASEYLDWVTNETTNK